MLGMYVRYWDILFIYLFVYFNFYFSWGFIFCGGLGYHVGECMLGIGIFFSWGFRASWHICRYMHTHTCTCTHARSGARMHAGAHTLRFTHTCTQHAHARPLRYIHILTHVCLSFWPLPVRLFVRYPPPSSSIGIS